jgi:ESCRT-I complex subunit VPS28
MAQVRAWDTAGERDELDEQANLFAIVRTADALEKAYARDAVPSAEYKQEMYKLIAHYKSARQATRESVPSMEHFFVENSISGGAGFERLEKGFPAVEKSSNPKTIAEAVQNFITLMDSLRLNMVACDQLQPLLNDLVEAMHKCNLDVSFHGNVKVEAWLTKLNGMSAQQELDEQSVRQMLFDLESAYNAFHKALK